MWMAGGGFKPGVTIGETDEIGYYTVKDRVHVHDLQAQSCTCSASITCNSSTNSKAANTASPTCTANSRRSCWRSEVQPEVKMDETSPFSTIRKHITQFFAGHEVEEHVWTLGPAVENFQN